MKPFTGLQLPSNKESFNCYLSSCRIVVENAFGRLKARWRILTKKIDAKIENVPLIVHGCCVLHNISETSTVRFDSSFMSDRQRETFEQPQPRPSTSAADTHAVEVRLALLKYISEVLPLRSSSRND